MAPCSAARDIGGRGPTRLAPKSELASGGVFLADPSQHTARRPALEGRGAAVTGWGRRLARLWARVRGPVAFRYSSVRPCSSTRPTRSVALCFGGRGAMTITFLNPTTGELVTITVKDASR
jgi:hypothetical protein